MTDWNLKIVAHLHDPPEKAYDYSPAHVDRSKIYMQNMGVPETYLKEKAPDHAAAAADRFIFPRAGKNLGDGVTFSHPLSGEKSIVDGGFPDEAEAIEVLSATLPDFSSPELSDRDRFWLLWRLWPHFAADTTTATGSLKERKGNLAYLPADTRIPDGSIWHHMSIVSALQSAMTADGELRPALLMFQLGPVQEFISQGRSTRDMWSGSYLLSWMMAQVLQRLSDRFGPDCVIFPNLRGQPLMDWLNRQSLKNAAYSSGEKSSRNYWDDLELGLDRNHDLILTPNLPNRLLAVVPEGCGDVVESIIAEVFDYGNPASEWRRIADACLGGMSEDYKEPHGGRSMWDRQLEKFWQYTWQLYPWRDEPETMEIFKRIPVGRESALHRGREVAIKIPEQVRDDRCYRESGGKESLHIGWPWSAHFQIAGYLLDARRQTRDFTAWKSAVSDESAVNGTDRHHRDAYSGREEAVATLGWIEDLRKNQKCLLRHLFRHNDELGAINLLKRTWHHYYLAKTHGFSGTHLRFPSVIAIASAPWIRGMVERLESGEDSDGIHKALTAFFEDVDALQEDDYLLDIHVGSENKSLVERVRSADASIFHRFFWERVFREERLKDRKSGVTGLDNLESGIREVLTRLDELYRQCGRTRPSSYFAVMALDGDQIGKWLSGEKTPAVREVMTSAAVEWFESSMGPDGETRQLVSEWLSSGRPVSPSYHLQFSEALSNFGVYCARRIVRAHGGELVYSGGDDVLALLPATEAIACARGLRLAFQGRAVELVKHHRGLYQSIFRADSRQGFLQLKDGDARSGARRRCEPSWPFLVPGPRATVSVGIAIGHIREPLQDLIQEAQAAEKRAKNVFDRNAIAVSLFKRSGEIIHWGTQFSTAEDTDKQESASIGILELIQQPGIGRPDPGGGGGDPKISGKFPYRLAELLLPYQSHGESRVMSGAKKADPLNEQLAGIAERELQWVLEQQAPDLDPPIKDRLIKLSSQYLRELIRTERPLTDFIHLFSIEAFIGRQGE